MKFIVSIDYHTPKRHKKQLCTSNVLANRT